jgi:hypothetical protein
MLALSQDTTSLLLQLEDNEEEYDEYFRSVDARIIEHVVETSQQVSKSLHRYLLDLYLKDSMTSTSGAPTRASLSTSWRRHSR